MTELTTTGSIRPGLSIASLMAEAARPTEVRVTPEVREGWRVANHLIQHLDNRADGDRPGSGKPEDEPRDAPLKIDGYLSYLMDTGIELPAADGYLTEVQREAFVGVRKHFDGNNFDPDRRKSFAFTLASWLGASAQAKAATSVNAYIQNRREEGRCLGELLTLATPPTAQGESFSSFVRRICNLGVVAKLFDSAVDLGRDRKNGVVNPLLSRTARLGAVALFAVEGTRFALTNLTLVPALGKKALALVINRTGKRNAERVHE